MEDFDIDSVESSSFEFDAEEVPVEEDKSRRWVYVYRIVIPLIVLGLLYITGVQQALFYQRTPIGTPQADTESILDAETITIPIRVFVFQNEENFGSERSVADIRQMVRNASEIWNQGDIDLKIDKIVFLDATDAEIGSFFDNPNRFVNGLDDYNPNMINAFLAKSLKGIGGVNGISFMSINTIAVADLTTIYDFRVFAHEVGHILGLRHVKDSNSRLMYSEANGFRLTREEVLRARETAVRF